MKTPRALFLTLTLFAAAKAGNACTCLPTATQDAFSRSDIVFRGELIAHEGNSAVFRVREYWKGNLRGSLELEWRRGDRGDCNGFWPDDLKVGNELVVFAVKSRFGVNRTSICLPTRLVASAEKELRDLGAGKPGQEVPKD